MQDCEKIARDEGLAAGLAAALSDVDSQVAAPGRFAAVPAASVPSRAPARTHSLAEREDIVFLECAGGGEAYDLVEIGTRLARVRLGVVRRVLDQAVEHLENRIAGEEPLLRKQLVTGAVADAMAEIELLRAYAETQHDPDALGDLHGRLDALGWEILKLFGAAGYMADHPACTLYVSALVANSWVDRNGAAR
jgi:hypothetical protein